MTDPYYLTDGAHVLISGATGAGSEYGGKSVLANWWFQESVEKGHHDLGVFYNPKGLSYVSDGFDNVARVRTVEDMADAIAGEHPYRDRGYQLIDFYPKDGGSEASHEPLIEFLRLVPGEKIVVHDEAQSFSDSEGLSWCLAQGGNMSNSAERTGDIRSLVVTQRPWNLPEEHRANMPLKVWVGPFGNEAEHFFNAERMPQAAKKVQENTGPFHWSVTDGGDYVTTMPPVPEEYA